MLYSIFKNFYLWLHCAFLTVSRLFLLVASACRGGGRGLLSSCGVQASHCAGLSCGAWALGCFSSCSPQALEQKLSSCGTRAQLFHSMRDLPGPGSELMSPALAGRFFTTEPPEKSSGYFYQEFWACSWRDMRIIKLQKPAYRSMYIYLFSVKRVIRFLRENFTVKKLRTTALPCFLTLWILISKVFQKLRVPAFPSPQRVRIGKTNAIKFPL